jgi:pimeloyl-ACP methyl ester carboxylesterase
MQARLRRVDPYVIVPCISIHLECSSDFGGSIRIRGGVTSGEPTRNSFVYLVAVRDETLAVRTLGHGGPVVVLLHGLAASNRYWSGAYDELADHARLVVPDLLGFGRSRRPDAGYGPDDHADAVAHCLQDLGADDTRAVIVGHSVGALVALRLAMRWPHLVSAVVGFAPPLFATFGDARRHLDRMGPLARVFGVDTRWAEFACEHLCQRHHRAAARLATWWRPDLPRAVALDAVEHSWASYSETLVRVVLAGDASRWIDEVDVPLRLLVGSRDRICDIDFVKHLASVSRHVEVDVWRDAGHHLPLELPAACRAEILAFVERERQPFVA